MGSKAKNGGKDANLRLISFPSDFLQEKCFWQARKLYCKQIHLRDCGQPKRLMSKLNSCRRKQCSLTGWKLLEGGKKIQAILNATLERTWYYILSESPISVKYVCGWKIQLRIDEGMHKTVENIYVFECAFLYRRSCKTPDKYIQKGAFRETTS